MNLRQIGLIGLMLPLAGFAQDPAILINPQGLAQRDLSIRGSSYTGTGISLNGMNFKVPYSAHYNADRPLYGPLVSDAQMLRGLQTVSGGLVGTAAYTMQPLQPQSSVSAGIGTKERYRATVFGSTEHIGGYIDGERRERSTMTRMIWTGLPAVPLCSSSRTIGRSMSWAPAKPNNTAPRATTGFRPMSMPRSVLKMGCFSQGPPRENWTVHLSERGSACENSIANTASLPLALPAMFSPATDR